MAEAAQPHRMAEIQGVATRMAEPSPQDHSVNHLSHAHDLAVEYLHNPPAVSMPTGFAGIDKWMRGGLRRKSLYAFAGRPREGKSSFVLSVARRMAIDGNFRVLYLSLEMTKQDLIERMICQSALCSIDRLELLRSQHQLEEFLKPIFLMLKERWFHVEDSRGAQIDQLEALLEELHPFVPDLIVIDHLQRIPIPYGVPSPDAINAYIIALSDLAKHHNIAILLACQINRSGDEKPSLVHLKGSGGIEENADVVLIGNRINYETMRVGTSVPDECEYEVWVAKNRRGPEYKFNLTFRGSSFEFLEPVTYSDPKLSLDDVKVIP